MKRPGALKKKMTQHKWLVIVSVLSVWLLVACTAVTEPDVTVSSTTVPDIPATPETEPEPTAVSADGLAQFTITLQTALTQRDFATAQAQMSDPFGFGPYRSEWSQLAPADMAAQLEMMLPEGATLQFNPEADVVAMLDGQNPQMMLGPDVTVTAVWHSSGWGAEGQDEAIMFIEEMADGRFAWKAMIYAPAGFLPESAELPILDEQPAPIGLLYSQPDGSLWQVGVAGQPAQLWYQEGTPATPSPDGKHAFYLIQGDLWLLDVTTGESRQLTSDHDDAGTHLTGFSYWYDDSTILTGLRLDLVREDGPTVGHPSLVDIETGEVVVLDADHLMSSFPAISTSGAVAYSSVMLSANDSQTTWIYQPDTGVTLFDRAAFPGAPEGVYSAPAWSVDGRFLAWLVSDGVNVQLTVFDQESGMVAALPAFTGLAFGGPYPNPIFSVDANWIALRQLTNDPPTTGLWLYGQDGGPPLFVAQNGGESLWVNDHLLLFLDYDENFNAQLQQYDRLTNVRSVVTLPAAFQIFGIAQP
jgi:hypothetical protein